jgi:hypothetical protein
LLPVGWGAMQICVAQVHLPAVESRMGAPSHSSSPQCRFKGFLTAARRVLWHSSS